MQSLLHLFSSFGIFLVTAILRWPMMSQNSHLLLVAGHFFMWSVVKFPTPQRKHFLLLTFSTAHTGSFLIATFELSATPILMVFYLLTPSSQEMAFCRASCGSLKGSTHSFSWTFLLFIFRMNTSCATFGLFRPSNIWTPGH